MLNTSTTLSYEAPVRPVVEKKQTVEEMIGNDILIAIATCESGLRQYNKDGSVLKGRIVPTDTGIFQISLKHHKKRLDKLGIDVFTLKGNIKYAKMLYKENGTKDWLASKKCWSKKI